MTENPEYPKPLVSSCINQSVVFEDEEGIYFKKQVETVMWNDYLRRYNDKGTITEEKIRPEQLGFSKELTTKVYVYKDIQSTENIQNETVWFEIELKFAFPEEKQYRYMWFYKTKSGRVFIRDFNFSNCITVGINDKTFVTQGKARKLDPETRIPRNSLRYRLNPATGELEEFTDIEQTDPIYNR
jgi:hypothetical protein